MPCLTNLIDCLLCGDHTSCSQVDGSNPDDPKRNWSVYFCKLFSIEDTALQEEFRQSYYCVPCACKIASIEKISDLVENMKGKLEEIRSVIEDNIYLSNTHLFGGSDIPGNAEEKTQNGLRERMSKVLESIKKRSTQKHSDVEILTDPVIILEADPQSDSPEHVIVLPDSPAGREDKECQCTLIQDPLTTVGWTKGGGGDSQLQANGKHNNRQLIKMLIKSQNVSQDIIKALTKPTGTSNTRQLIIRGYREIEQSGEDAEDSNLTPGEPEVVGATRRRCHPRANEKKSTVPAVRNVSNNRPRIPPEVCKLCHVKFDNAEATRAHVESHREGSLWKCPHCNTTVVTEKSLIRHVNKHYDSLDSEVKNLSEETKNEVNEPENATIRRSVRPRNKRKRKDSSSEPEESVAEEPGENDGQTSDENYEVSDESSDRSMKEESPRRKSPRKRVTTRKVREAEDSKSQPPQKRGRPPKKTNGQVVIKVASNKRVSSSVVEDTPQSDDLQGGRLRSKYRTYFF